MNRLNRRQLTRALLESATVVSAAASAAASMSAQTPGAGQSADELLAAAKRQLESNRAVLDKIPLPMSTEPASAFKAI